MNTRSGAQSASASPHRYSLRLAAWLFPKPTQLSLWLLAGLTLLIFIPATRWGIGINPDSITYLALGDVLMAQAPLYVWLMQAVGGLGLDVVASARFIHALLLFVNSALVLAAIYLGGRSVFAATLGALLCLTCTAVLQAHVLAMSEPLFLFLLLLSLLSLAAYLGYGHMELLVTSAVFGSMSVLCRFAGAPIVGVGALAILLWLPEPFWKRLRASTIFGTISTVPLALYVLATGTRSDGGLGREFAFNGNPDLLRLYDGLSELTSMYLPVSVVSFWIRCVALVLSIGLIAYFTRKHLASRSVAAASRTELRHAAGFYVAPLCLLYTVAYLLFVLLAQLIEADLPISVRYMVPLYYMAAIATISMVVSVLSTDASHNVKLRLLTFVGLGLLTLNGIRATAWTAREFVEGNGYTGRLWTNSETMDLVRQLPNDVSIYTNGPDAIEFLAKRPADQVHLIPGISSDRRVGRPNENYIADIEQMRNTIRNDRGFIVYFDLIDWRYYLPEIDELSESIPLETYARGEDGAIYRLADNN